MTGLALGIVILLLILTPMEFRRLALRADAAVRQENLVAQSGYSTAYAAAYEETLVPVTVTVSGDAAAAVSPDGTNWYDCDASGAATFRLAPGTYRLRAAANSKLVYTDVTVPTPSASPASFTLDLGKAPDGADLLLYTLPAGSPAALTLPVSGATTLEAAPLPNGVSITLGEDGGATLAVSPGMAGPGFYPIRLTLTNQYGRTLVQLGLTLDAGAPVTEIATAADLKLLAENPDGNFLLTDDLDLSGADDWTPLFTMANPFTGHLDGGGHEITGFHAPAVIETGEVFSFLGYAQNAVIENLIFRDVDIQPTVPARESGVYFNCCTLGNVTECLVQNCAVVGGVVHPSDGAAAGLLGDNTTVGINLFNSATVICEMEKKWLPNTGGVSYACGLSFLKYCANEGTVKGNHLTGGIASFARDGYITQCVNSGEVSGRDLVGEYPAGGICQTTDYGTVTASVFVRGQSAVGCRVFGTPAVVAQLAPVTAGALSDAEALAVLGTFEADGLADAADSADSDADPQWCYASLDAVGPVPYGIFKERTAAPALEGGKPAAQDGAEFRYTEVDGETWVKAVSKGKRDSEWVKMP